MSNDLTNSNGKLDTIMDVWALPVDCPRYSFRTTAAGRIPLTQDWGALLDRMRWMSNFFVQVDHAHVRMSMRMKRRDYLHSLNGTIQSNGLMFSLPYAGWSHAHARIENCDCCESVGGLNVMNSHGASFLQISPSADVSALEWATLLSGITTDLPDAVDDDAADDDEPCRVFSLTEQLPVGAVDLHMAGEGCLRLFNQFAVAGIPLEFTCCAGEVDMRQSYAIHTLRASKGVLECSGQSGGFSIFLPAVDASYAMFEQGRLTWLLVDANQRVLFKVRSVLGAGSEYNFQQLLDL